jgi:hypothetical protein
MTEMTGFPPEPEPVPAPEPEPEPVAPEPEVPAAVPVEQAPPAGAPFIPDQGVADWLREALLYLHGLITGS